MKKLAAATLFVCAFAELTLARPQAPQSTGAAETGRGGQSQWADTRAAGEDGHRCGQ